MVPQAQVRGLRLAAVARKLGFPMKRLTPRVFSFWPMFVVALAGATSAFATEPAETAPRDAPWTARWIAHPTASPTDYGVYRFRRKFTLPAKPEKFLIHVSGDNRYRLYVNGTSVSCGPARSDLLHWRYETVDIAPQLRAGENVLAADVRNYGEHRAVALIGLRTGLLVQGHGAAEQVANTGAEWRVWRDESIAPWPLDRAALRTYIVVAPGEDVDGAKFPWGWTEAAFDDGAWLRPREYARATPHGVGTEVAWWLEPRPIPLPEETEQRIPAVRRAEGVAADTGFLAGGAPLVVPAHTTATLLLDQTYETSAYPRLLVSGGKGAEVTLHYAEALFDAARAKGHRNEIDGKKLIGVGDRFRPDGGARRLFTTADYRTYRYLELAVRTAEQPLTIHDLHGTFTAYPFRERGRFASDDASLAEIWNVGWRTARLCAFETYMDCPYYEQLQYVGDTRIQALISLYVAGDDRLMRNAIEQFDRSRLPEGLTQSRYPNSEAQVIGPFSLWWVGMVHDYWRHRDDAAFVSERLTGVASVLEWFEKRLDAKTGLLGPLPYWSFVDWPDEWSWSEAHPGGTPAGAADGGSSILSLQFVIALDQAAELEQALGRPEAAAHHRALAAALRQATLVRCWDEKRQLVADTPEKKIFSQHANVLAVLAGALPPEAAREVIGRVADDRSLIQATLYFRFYLLRAMKAAGLGDRYVTMLGPWRAMLAAGLTTFAEKLDPTRSDCHAWSASPNYELLATVCGIEPDAPGFKAVKIEPHPGPLTRFEGEVPHPAGTIAVRFARDGERLRGTVTLPDGLAGRCVWRGRTLALHGGTQEVDL